LPFSPAQEPAYGCGRLPGITSGLPVVQPDSKY
jgi:hypothetical protein